MDMWERIKKSELYTIAEISANHGGNMDNAFALIDKCVSAGADCVKFQCYRPDNLTLETDHPFCKVDKGLWKGKTLYELYQEACTPPEWIPELKAYAEARYLDFLCTAYDADTVQYLFDIGCEVIKVASFEITHIPMLQKIAELNMPAIVSTGLASMQDIVKVNEILKKSGVAYLVCKSDYPTNPSKVPLGDMNYLYSLSPVVGISDHTMTNTSCIAAIAKGATIIEKHVKLENVPSADSKFSLTCAEFADLVLACKQTLKMRDNCQLWKSKETIYRRSVWVVKPVKSGELLTEDNIKVLRPEGGVHPAHYCWVLGKYAGKDLDAGKPLFMHDVIPYERTML